MTTTLLLIWFAFLNRARGTKLFGLTDSDTISRIVTAFGMALAITLADVGDPLYLLPWNWSMLFLCMVMGWDKYWSAEIGNDPNHSKGWGIINMCWRLSLFAIPMVGTAFITHHPEHAVYALGTLFLWLPYYIFGAINKGMVIERAEPTVGALLALLFSLTTS